ncbi:hypothetical protein TEA_004449 [Camellia sinensis var. sinensis]|uniref:V-type proton ATPase subunit n=1 Tax=Camellia sinensis var. sinensis TaxID=542762 RepID=A0A4V3WIS0_CAMSN|nr:hypothetical protein TEA_004449 [Camellia sinensis var. sinensis]
MYGFEAMTFNIHGGYLEAIVRGYRSGLLTAADYNNLCQCETLDDIKMHLSATEYGPYLQNEPSPLHTTTIVEKCTLKLVDEYKHMLCQATEPLSTFLEYITYGHMIDNVVLIVTGTLHERDVQELLEKCHPLGMFDSIATLAVAQNMRELYRLVLVDTPLAPYFSKCITSEDLDDMNIEIMRNTLYKAYLEDFYRFCQKLGGATAEIMSDLLAFEADRRAVNITINSIGTELTRDDRKKLYSSFGLLYPYGREELAVCEDIDQVRAVMEKYPPYQSIFAKLSYGESQMLDKAFYEEEVKRLCLAFEQQFHYAVFLAYMRLKEQEIRNLMWISECVAQNQKSRVHDSVGIEELKHCLLYTTLELETTILSTQQEIARKEDELNYVKELLTKAMKERDEAKAKYQSLRLQLQQQLEAAANLSGTTRDAEDKLRGGSEPNNVGSLSSNLNPQLPLPMPLAELTEKLASKKPVPEKGKFLEVVMEAGPLLQTLLLAGPLPRWQHPPPPLNSIEIPPVTAPLPTPRLLHHQDSTISTTNSCFSKEKGLVHHE